MNQKFTLGQVVATPGALDALQRCNVNPSSLLDRHICGDWGIVDDEDKQANEDALKYGTRIVSAYYLPDETKIWIITEAADARGYRMSTTILLPEEY